MGWRQAMATAPRGDDFVVLARRTVALGITVSVPVLVGIWITDSADDPMVRWGYPLLLLHLMTFAWVLLRRARWAGPAALVSLIGLEAWWLSMAVSRVVTAPNAGEAWSALFPTPLQDVGICLVVGFLFLRTRVALVHGAVYLTAVLAALAVSLLSIPDGESYLWPLGRYGVYQGVLLVLLLVLARAKERVARAVEAANRADADANRMRDMAYLDELTGLANRRRLLEELAHQARLVGPDHQTCVVYLDLDHFKQLNDTLGHDVGDRALRAVAAASTRLVHDGDLVARLGGEEFVIVTPSTSPDRASELAERLRRAVPVEVQAATGTRVTASFGVTELLPGEDPAAALQRVDSLMYLAKDAGRDRVWSAGPPQPAQACGDLTPSG